jgi:hypothetical protein
MFFQPPPPVPPAADMADFFQHMRVEEALVRGVLPGTKRGILRVNL